MIFDFGVVDLEMPQTSAIMDFEMTHNSHEHCKIKLAAHACFFMMIDHAAYNVDRANPPIQFHAK